MVKVPQAGNSSRGFLTSTSCPLPEFHTSPFPIRILIRVPTPQVLSPLPAAGIWFSHPDTHPSKDPVLSPIRESRCRFLGQVPEQRPENQILPPVMLAPPEGPSCFLPSKDVSSPPQEGEPQKKPVGAVGGGPEKEERRNASAWSLPLAADLSWAR